MQAEQKLWCRCFLAYACHYCHRWLKFDRYRIILPFLFNIGLVIYSRLDIKVTQEMSEEESFNDDGWEKLKLALLVLNIAVDDGADESNGTK